MQSPATACEFAEAFLLSTIVLRDCHVGLRPPRNDKSEAFPILTAAGTESTLPSRDCHVGLRPPRNDKSEAAAILTAVCTDCKCVAGSGMPLPYKGQCGRRSATKPTACKALAERRYRRNWYIPFYRQPVHNVSAVPGRAVPSPTFAPSPSANLAEFSGVFRTKCSDFPHLISLLPVL